MITSLLSGFARTKRTGAQTPYVVLTIGVELLELLEASEVEICEAITDRINVRLVVNLVDASVLWDFEHQVSADPTAKAISVFLRAWCLAACNYPDLGASLWATESTQGAVAA